MVAAKLERLFGQIVPGKERGRFADALCGRCDRLFGVHRSRHLLLLLCRQREPLFELLLCIAVPLELGLPVFADFAHIGLPFGGAGAQGDGLFFIGREGAAQLFGLGALRLLDGLGALAIRLFELFGHTGDASDIVAAVLLPLHAVACRP